MLTEEGIIENVYGERATVLIRRSAACAHCDSQGACEVADDKTMHIVLLNELHARIGDRVQISLPSNSLLKLSFVVYFLPVVALVIGASLGDVWGPFFQMKSVTGSIFGGGIGLLGTYFIMKWVNRRAGERMEYRPRITRVFSAEPLQLYGSRSDHTADTVLTHSTPAPRSIQGQFHEKDY